MFAVSTTIMLGQINHLHAEEQVLSTLGCMLTPSEEVEVSSPVTGILDKVSVSRGTKVKKGQRLFQLKAGVEREGVQLATVKAGFAKRKVSRNKELFDENIITPHERDEMETELLIAQSELRLRQQELALRTVYSPINGVVVNRNNSKGEYVSIDPILSLATLDPLHVDLLLPSNYFGQIALKDKLLIKPASDIIESRLAEVITVDPLIDPASGTFRVQLIMSNPKNKIPAGLRCSAQVSNES